MNEQVSSVLVNGLNYDFEFEQTTLKEEDASTESDLHVIDIFGNNHSIAMGNKMIHIENDDLVYFNVYLIYDQKVVSKIGIYEILEEDREKQEALTHRNVDFSSLQLLLDNKYYVEPQLLEPYIQNMDMNEENNESIPQQDHEEESQKEDSFEPSENQEPIVLSEYFKGVIGELEEGVKLSTHYTPNKLNNIVILYIKSIIPLLQDKSMKTMQNKQTRGVYKSWFPNSEFKLNMIDTVDSNVLTVSYTHLTLPTKA